MFVIWNSEKRKEYYGAVPIVAAGATTDDCTDEEEECKEEDAKAIKAKGVVANDQIVCNIADVVSDCSD